MHAIASGYSTLEFDLHSGTRGSRADHCRAQLARLTGAADALVVNNAAGALVLALNAVARGREVIISRGELIEIGGSFRIPDILEKSGARLREVGTTNRTHLADYEDAIGPDTGAILIVHRSNFAQSGFVATPEPARARRRWRASAASPCLHDVGSGLLLDLSRWGLSGEPLVRDAVVDRRRPRALQWRQAAGRPAGGMPRGTAGPRRRLPAESVRPRPARRQDDARRPRGDAGTVRR